MVLRDLKLSDAPLMLEWMHDATISQQFRFDTKRQTLATVEAFIKKCAETEVDKHYAITDKTDEYMGTISLKHIDNNDKTAEYAVVLRAQAQGTGLARQATRAILDKAFNEMGLNKVYLNVLSHNKRAIRFYESFGFKFEGEFKNHIMIQGEPKDLKWYAVFREDYLAEETDAVRMIKFNQLGDERGHLVVMEQFKDVPFDIKRIFYIYGSDPDVVRGQHANRKSCFMLINVAGTSKVDVHDGEKVTTYRLDEPHEGIYLPKMVWKDMYDFSPDSVLLVLASEHYDPDEYIRDYDAYLKEIKG